MPKLVAVSWRSQHAILVPPLRPEIDATSSCAVFYYYEYFLKWYVAALSSMTDSDDKKTSGKHWHTDPHTYIHITPNSKLRAVLVLSLYPKCYCGRTPTATDTTSIQSIHKQNTNRDEQPIGWKNNGGTTQRWRSEKPEDLNWAADLSPLIVQNSLSKDQTAWRSSCKVLRCSLTHFPKRDVLFEWICAQMSNLAFCGNVGKWPQTTLLQKQCGFMEEDFGAKDIRMECIWRQKLSL